MNSFPKHTIFFLSLSLFFILSLFDNPQQKDVVVGTKSLFAAIAEDDKWEEKFRAIPNPDSLRAYMKRLSARPHHLGSPYDKDNAEWMLRKFKSWGLEAQIESFEVLFPSPKVRVVELVEPRKFTAKLMEPKVAVDPTSGQHDEQLPSYNGYSADGDVTAPLIYVNYGIPEDYEQLERLGISVKGAIVIARYGASWRGIKPKLAAEHGAVGCLIYSDPRDDGFHQGDVFPKGPWRPSHGVQRGSVMDMPLYPGDPLTPGIGATANAKRLELKDVKTITAIPVLPISYGDAQPLLEALEGPVASAGWRGALPITYHVGPGPAKVHLKVQANWDMKTIYNVVARIPGSEFPDEWVIRGNHHDAWVNGAQDPTSGMVALMEEARAFAEMLKQGWRPKRTMFFIGWDAEEQGLIGSTEWAEAHAEELKQNAALYINTDSNGRGYLGVAGSHTLEKFINNVARDVEDPHTKLSVWKRAQLRRIANTNSAQSRSELRNRSDLRIGALGSGSDYTAFLDHLGVASLNLGFGGMDGGGIYHSVYDDFYWFTHFSDTDFIYGRALAQTAGTAALRFADADLLSYDFSNFAETIGGYVDDLKNLANNTREEIIELNRQIDEGVFAATVDPREPVASPEKEEVPPFLNFAPLENVVVALKESAEQYKKAAAQFTESGKKVPAGVNKKLIQSEQKLTLAEGLPGRPWFKHQVYAPGFYTGYGVKTLPAVREAIEQKEWQNVEAHIASVAKVLSGFAEHVASIAVDLDASSR